MNRQLFVDELNKVGVELDDTALDRFELFEKNLIEWNERVNLTAITESDEIVTKHFVDSLSVLPYAKFTEGASLIDVGCGAGFPSLPLLIARPDLKITFLDSINKKLMFIEDTLRVLGLDGTVMHERAEVLGKDKDYREGFDFAVTRAVAPLNVLAEYCVPLLKTGGTYVSMKGQDSEARLGMNAVKTLGAEIDDIISFELPNGDKRNLIFIKKISQTPTQYPRNAKKITTKPL